MNKDSKYYDESSEHVWVATVFNSTDMYTNSECFKTKRKACDYICTNVTPEERYLLGIFLESKNWLRRYGPVFDGTWYKIEPAKLV